MTMNGDSKNDHAICLEKIKGRVWQATAFKFDHNIIPLLKIEKENLIHQSLKTTFPAQYHRAMLSVAADP